MTREEKYALVGKQVPAADGGNYGHRIVGYDEELDDFIVIQITWDTNKMVFHGTLGNRFNRLNTFKASYRYNLDKAIPIQMNTKDEPSGP
jgi:hypothetical protein